MIEVYIFLISVNFLVVIIYYSFIRLFEPCGSAGKKIHLQCGRPGFDPWVGKIPWRKERLPTPVSWPGKFHGLYSPWNQKESFE